MTSKNVGCLNLKIRVVGATLATCLGTLHHKLYGDTDAAAQFSGRFMLIFTKAPGRRWEYCGRVTKGASDE